MAAVKGDPRNLRAYRKRRLQVLNRDNWVCYYCGGDATQADHVIPISRGGDPMDLDGMVASCKRCNVSKGNKSQGAFLATRDTPPVFLSCLSPKTAVTALQGPCMGQESQNKN
jgi:5-methylcytosine-specific restriction endonuclease McrA